MSPENLFRIHLVLGYVAWALCFGAYVWPRLKAIDRVSAKDGDTLDGVLVFCANASAENKHERHAASVHADRKRISNPQNANARYSIAAYVNFRMTSESFRLVTLPN